MREAVQVAAAAVDVADVVDVADIAMARGTSRAIEVQKAAIFMVARVGKEIIK
jgi:hypothetical protein